MKKPNGLAKWIIVAIAVATMIFNTAILYNDVKHLSEDVKEIKVLLIEHLLDK